MSQARITIVEPNGVERTRPLGRRLSIGRGAENELVLGYDKISRNHARITFDQGYYYVTDLGSSNGVYLGGEKLPPNQPVVWESNQVLQLGDVQIYLDYSPATQPSEARDISQTYLASGDTNLGLNIDSSRGQGSPFLWIILALVGLVVLLALGGVVAYFLFV